MNSGKRVSHLSSYLTAAYTCYTNKFVYWGTGSDQTRHSSPSVTLCIQGRSQKQISSDPVRERKPRSSPRIEQDQSAMAGKELRPLPEAWL